jgi:single-strand DNA-binding protein
MNNFIFTGNLGKDAEVKYLSSGSAVCEFSVAVKSGYGDREKTNWVRCAMLGKKAEGQLPQYLLKGTQVAVSGELELQEWEGEKGKGAALSVSVQNIDLIGGKQDQVQQPQQAPQASPQAAPSARNYYFQDGTAMNNEQAQYYISRGVQPWPKGTPPPVV